MVLVLLGLIGIASGAFYLYKKDKEKNPLKYKIKQVLKSGNIITIHSPNEEQKKLQKLLQFKVKADILKQPDGSYIDPKINQDFKVLSVDLQKTLDKNEEEKLKAIQDRINKIKLDRSTTVEEEVFSHAKFHKDKCIIILFKRVGVDIMYIDHKVFTIK